MRHTIRGIIIKDRKVLLVTGHGADFYWTPGGGVEANESIEETLHREIMEELGVAIQSFKPYLAYEYESQRVENFLIEIEGDITPGSEITDVVWYSTTALVNPSTGFRDALLPSLIEDGLID